MSIWNDISGVLNKGMEGAGRIADATSLRFKLGEMQRKRRDLATDLGEQLYASLEAGGELPAECSRIVADMRACDADIAKIKEDMERIACEAQVAKEQRVSYSCAKCGATLAASSRFCHVCGAPTVAGDPSKPWWPEAVETVTPEQEARREAKEEPVPAAPAAPWWPESVSTDIREQASADAQPAAEPAQPWWPESVSTDVREQAYEAPAQTPSDAK